MTMTSTNIKIINTLLFVDSLLIGFCIFMGDRDWLYSSQIAFFTSALVISASMISYRKMVNRGVALGAIVTDDNRDELDKLDDPHDLYSEDEGNSLKEEKAKLKENRRSLKEVAKDSRASFSFFRLGAYIILVLGFFYLNRHDYLHIPSYLISLSFPPLVIVSILLSEAYTKTKELQDG